MTATDPNKTVFISYRRSVSKYIARSIFLDLHQKGYDAFLDVKSIDNGSWETIILNQIAARTHFLLVLTPGTLDRCSEPNDMLRREIEQAIDLGRNIVLLLAENYDFKSDKAYLTDKLSVLPKYNALNLYYDYFDEGMEKLRSRFLKQPAYHPVITPTPPHESSQVKQSIEMTANQPTPTKEELDAEEILLRGYDNWKNGYLDDAIADQALAIQIDPNFTAAYVVRGFARADKGDLDGAIADWTQAMQLDPELAGTAENYSIRGVAHRMNGNLDEAIADHTLAIQLKPDYADAYNNRGVAHAGKGDLDSAIVDYNWAIQIKPDYADAYNNRGDAHTDKGDFEGAINDYNQAIYLKPSDGSFHNNRGLAYVGKGDLEAAIADYNQAIQLQPDDASPYNNRGEVYFACRQYSNSLLDFKKANDLRPGYNFALAGLAITHHALGNLAEAHRLWKLLITMDVHYKDVDWAKQKLDWPEPLVDEARKLIAEL